MKLIAAHPADPSIAVNFTETLPGVPGKAQGYYGRCTECPRTMHRWHQDKALEAGRRHVLMHRPHE